MDNTTMHHHFAIEDAEKHGVEAAVILNNIRYWLSHNKASKKNIIDGYVWTFNSAQAYAELMPYLNRLKIQRLLTRLEKAGALISSNYNKKQYDRTKWYSMPEFQVIENNHCSKLNNALFKTEQPIPNKNTDKNLMCNEYNLEIEQKNESSKAEPKITQYFFNQLCPIDFKLTIEAMGELERLKPYYKLYDGHMPLSDWSEVESKLRIIANDNEGFDCFFFKRWLEINSKAFKKKSGPSILDMLKDNRDTAFDEMYLIVMDLI